MRNNIHDPPTTPGFVHVGFLIKTIFDGRWLMAFCFGFTRGFGGWWLVAGDFVPLQWNKNI